MGEVEKVSAGRISMGPGTLYGVLTRMKKEGLILLAEDDGRRKVYRITAARPGGAHPGICPAQGHGGRWQAGLRRTGMGRHKYSLNMPFWQIGEAEHWYADQAAAGWLLRKRGAWLTRFDRGAPQRSVTALSWRRQTTPLLSRRPCMSRRAGNGSPAGRRFRSLLRLREREKFTRTAMSRPGR